MKKLIVITLFTAASFVTKAQAPNIEGLSFGLGTTWGIPVKDVSGIFIGAGIDAMAQYGVSPHFSITGDVGYLSLFAKNNGNDLNIVPIRIGARYFATASFT